MTLTGADATAVKTFSDGVSVITATGERIEARVAIAADGRNSVLRESAGIKTNRWAYDQSAIATSFAHSGPHDGISTEYHKGAGPFTTVPMPGKPLRPCVDGAAGKGGDHGADRCGACCRNPDRHAWRAGPHFRHRQPPPLSDAGHGGAGFREEPHRPHRESAHVVPPIGAQGLNMSLRDAAQAAELMLGEDDPGQASVLSDYDALRRRDVHRASR